MIIRGFLTISATVTSQTLCPTVHYSLQAWLHQTHLPTSHPQSQAQSHCPNNVQLILAIFLFLSLFKITFVSLCLWLLPSVLWPRISLASYGNRCLILKLITHLMTFKFCFFMVLSVNISMALKPFTRFFRFFFLTFEICYIL